MTSTAKTDLSKVVSLSEVSSRPTKQKPMTEVMTLPTPFDDDDDDVDYKWAEIRDRLELSSNVANARWMPEKLMPLFANLEAPAILTIKGKPTKFCAQMIARYKRSCVDDGNDYKLFCAQVQAAFTNRAETPAKVEVLTADDGGDEPSSLIVLQQQLEAKDDSLESQIMRTMQAKQQASKAETQYRSLTQKAWEQQVIEDELANIQEEQERKKQEFELRLKVRQMLGSQDSQS